jgi:serine/threonine-protein kinase
MSQAAAIPLRAPCPRCGYLADAPAGEGNYCPKCGADVRAAPSTLHAVPPSLAGQVIADRYRLLSLLGEGGMGTVWKAEHVRMGKALAVKLLRGAFADDPAAVARFRAEAQIVSRLSHPHTIGVFDFGEIGAGEPGFYLAMEYVPGRDLARVLRETRCLPEARALAIADQLLGSLGEAHEAGIVHRDVKPGNVMLMETRAEGDFVKVLDFGIAKLRGAAVSGGGSAAPGHAAETSAGLIVGTPNYLSPEQARGQSLDARSDLYSVGALLYELVAGRPPFAGPNPMAIVGAHISRPPPPLAEVAPDVSADFAAVVHRALEKRPADRFQTADEMRLALQRIALPVADAEPPDPDEVGQATTGDLEIARRRDFGEVDRHIRRIRRARLLAPLAVAALLAGAGALAWRWSDAYVFLHERFPSAASALPAALRPADFFDGTEHEPNDVPDRANPLPLPPSADGRRAMGVAAVWGHVGAKLNASTGDVDVFRIDVPPRGGPLVLHAEWSAAAGTGEGIKGLDVALTLNRARTAGDARSAPVVATADRRGAGRAESLAAAVVPGTYFLAVREKHADATGPVEKPTDPYTLRVWLAEPAAGEEMEPNDEPESVAQRWVRWPQWRALAERNALGEGAGIRATTSAEDADTFAVVSRRPAEVPEAVLLVPEPRLALRVEAWAPDAEDLGPERAEDRARFQRGAEGGPGEVLFLRLPGAARPGAPVLLRVRAARGEGGYEALALGQGSASGPAALRVLDALAKEGRGVHGLMLAAELARQLPGSSAKAEVLLAAGKLAERLASAGPAPDAAAAQRISQLLGEPLYEGAGARLRYAGAFEALVQGEGRVAEEASFRLVLRARPCGPTEVARRAGFFLQRFPAAERADEARLLEARAEEEGYWRGGGKDAEALRRATAAYGRAADAASPEVSAEGKRALKRLSGKRPQRPGKPIQVCR